VSGTHHPTTKHRHAALLGLVTAAIVWANDLVEPVALDEDHDAGEGEGEGEGGRSSTSAPTC